MTSIRPVLYPTLLCSVYGSRAWHCSCHGERCLLSSLGSGRAQPTLATREYMSTWGYISGSAWAQ